MRKMPVKPFQFFLALLLVFFVAGTAHSLKLSTELEAEAKKIEEQLIAPCCMVQPVSIHPSHISTIIKAEIREMLADGKSRQEIFDYYVEKYGLQILASPPQTGFNRLSVWMPVIFFLVGLGTVALIIKIWAASGPMSRQVLPAAGQIDEKAAKQIERELQAMD